MPNNVENFSENQLNLISSGVEEAQFDSTGQNGDYIRMSVFDSNSNLIAQGLLELGIKPDSRIAYLAKNTDYFFEILKNLQTKDWINSTVTLFSE